MNILVVGGAGYVGSVIVSELVESGHAVRVFDDLSTGYLSNIHPGANFFLGTLTDATQIFAAMEGIEAVVHCAFKTSDESANYREQLFWHTNYIGTTNLINAMILNNVKKLVVSSTCKIYKPIKNKKITENNKTQSENIFSVTKESVDDMLLNVANGRDINITILRYFDAYGAHKSDIFGYIYNRNKNEDDFILNTIKNIKNNKLVCILNNSNKETKDGTIIRDYLHVTDLAKAHILSIFKQQKNKFEIINLGTEKEYTLIDVLKLIEKVSNKKIKIVLKKEKINDFPKLISSNKKAKNLLGWKPEKTLEDIIQELYDCINTKIKRKKITKKPKNFEFKKIV